MPRFSLRPLGACLVTAALLNACDSAPTALRDASSLRAPAAPSHDVIVAAGTVSSVAVNYISGNVDTVTWTLPVGGQGSFKAAVTDTSGKVIAATARYYSTNATALYVDSISGLATARAAGTAAITVTVAGVSGTSKTITVPVPPPSVTLTAALQRFDGATGTVMVSNGVPLAPGLVTPANIKQVHVLVKGVEQRVYVKGLFGKWPDGSYRSILVQLNYSIPNATPIAASIVIGGGNRIQADLAARAAVQVPQAAVLPSDPTYLVTTKWTGTTYAASTPAATPLLAQYEGDYLRLEAADWKACAAAWSCSRTAGYDRAFTAYQYWQRTGNATLWYHATAEAADYLKNYIIPNASPTPWWAETEGVAVQYWSTGDEKSRYQLRKMAEMLAWQGRAGTNYALNGTYGDDRMRAKILTAGLDAIMLEIITQPADAATYYNNEGGPPSMFAQYLTPATVPAWITGLLSTQRTNGEFGGRQYSNNVWDPTIAGGQSNYMVGMLLMSMVRYYEEVSPDPRIVASVKACIDDLTANEFDTKTLGFDYNSQRGYLANSTVIAPANPLPGLNGLIVPAYAWYAKVSADPTYVTKTDQLLQGLTVDRGWWPMSGKAFDQAFYRLGNVFAWRAGM